MLLMLPLGILFGLSCGTAALQEEQEGSLSAAAAAPVPVADLVQALQVEMMMVKKTQLMENTGLKSELTELRKENTGLKSELLELRQESAEMKTDMHKLQTKLQLVEKENTGLKSELIELRKVVSSSMDPQLEEQVMNTFKVGSIEEDVQENQEDIIDLRIVRIDVGHHDMQIGQMLNQINNVNTTLNNEIVTLDERLEKQLTNVEERLTNMEERLANMEDLGSGLQQVREAVCGYHSSLKFSTATNLTFDRVYDEVNSSCGGELQTEGVFTAGVTGIYFITLETMVGLYEGREVRGELLLSSGNYIGNNEERFINSYNGAGGIIYDQASASRYVRMLAGETLHISLYPNGGWVEFYSTTMCVSLYSASG